MLRNEVFNSHLILFESQFLNRFIIQKFAAERNFSHRIFYSFGSNFWFPMLIFGLKNSK